MERLCRDLEEEYAALDAIVSPLSEAQWDTVTPFYDWTVRNEIIHIAFFDGIGRLAATDPAGFAKHLEELAKTNVDHFEDDYMQKGRMLGSSVMLTRWREDRKVLLDVLGKLDPKARLPWYGPPMSARSFATARMMETWAHGQDVVDTLGLERPATSRLQHVAHIGVTTFGWSFVNRGMKPPEATVRVELVAPGGELWTWGPEDAKNCVKGKALDFCLVVTQRRNVADTGLDVKGEAAQEWMRLAQAFAGPPVMGPAPGERV